MQTQGACEEKLENLNIEYQKLEEEITKLKAGLDKQINENSEDKKRRMGTGALCKSLVCLLAVFLLIFLP